MVNNKVIHWIASLLVFGIPLLVSAHVGTDLTVGAILNAIYLWASHKVLPTERV